jgi:hypothetical protein
LLVYPRGRHPMVNVPEIEAELRRLLHSYEYAYAMGHGCSIGDHPRFRATRQRAADLRALIAEHKVV